MVAMVFLAVFFGKRYRHASYKQKNKVLIAAAIIIDSFETAKVIIACILEGSAEPVGRMLPLFLCGIQLVAIPVAAFSRGRFKYAALDFVLIFGILGAVLGVYAAAQNYNAYPVLSWPNIVSGITHSVSGFASLYILFSGMADMKKRNVPICLAILSTYCVLAFTANRILDYNYMFLEQGDGTPYDILYNLVGGNPILYPLCVVALFFLYITVFYLVYTAILRKRAKGA